MYIFHFGHYSFDMWAHPLNHIGPHAPSRSLGQCILTIFGHHVHQSWPEQLNQTGQHEKIMFQLNCSDHRSAKISWHTLNGHLYTSAGLLLVWKVTEGIENGTPCDCEHIIMYMISGCVACAAFSSLLM